MGETVEIEIHFPKSIPPLYFKLRIFLHIYQSRWFTIGEMLEIQKIILSLHFQLPNFLQNYQA